MQNNRKAWKWPSSMANQNTLFHTHQEVGEFTNKSKLGIVFLVSKNDIILFWFKAEYKYFSRLNKRFKKTK